MALKRIASSAKLQQIKSLISHQIDRITVNDKFKRATDIYEEFLGIKQVNRAQDMVLKSESEFIKASNTRRQLQQQLHDVQSELKQVRQKIDSTQRGDEAYLTLITSEHQLIKTEMNTLSKLRLIEEQERELFTSFSQRLREAHEIERLRQEKTKSLSLILSVFGGVVGVLATSVSHWSKMRNINSLVKIIESQQAALKESQANASKEPSQPVAVVSQSSHSKEQASKEVQTDDNIRPEQLTELMASTEENLMEVQMKLNTIGNVVKVYAALAIAIPIITAFLLGSR